MAHELEVTMAKAALVEATAQARRAGHRDMVADAAMKEAWEVWMDARARAGDRFAISLGYTGHGWSFDAWLAGRTVPTA